ncbi:hypothetical protein D6853_02860 [Butyrivibrio sp. X503]|uniref:hypothetical protein n=1 Tax=Butyrivibrio sp. X503 TaxID=2364878 RepID=UPI000EA9303D|nr:hypothetical protein [Butyrivibrio sp. X503]RKM56977.1 hypothetical protein D6853_02860 [Butyrivibrio sp. X503]
MNRTKKIKEIIGKVLSEKGFEYIRCESGIVWTFGRKIGEVEQEVYIQQHTRFDKEYKLMFWTSAKGNGMKEIGNVLSEYEKKEYWEAESDEEFLQILEFFVSFIKEHGFDLLEDMLEEKPDSFETPERKQYFKEHRKELVEKYDGIYHILGQGTREEQLKHIDEVLWENREAEETPEKEAEIQELWLGMAAVLTEIIFSIEGAKIDYDSWRIKMNISNTVLSVWPVYDVIQAWMRYHFDNDKSILLVWASARSLVR